MGKFLNFFTSKPKHKEGIILDENNIPKHIGIIMDGNGRWAKSKGLPRTAGHKVGVETIREILVDCNKLGVKYLTIYAFSTENWRRPKEEVNTLMGLLIQYLRKELKEINNQGVVIKTIGEFSGLPELCRKEIREAEEKTKDNKGLTFNIALNYGGRDEIVHAVKELYKDIKVGNIEEKDISKAVFEKYLYTAGMPDPDIIIRTSGEQRLSNFLPWQAAYSELWFTDIYWPDFKKETLREAIYDYQNRERRFGGIK
ncbi:MAG: isoprenyl transferase [Clostridium sp.]